MGIAMRGKQSFINITCNFFSIFISMGLSFFITPFLVKTIGAESYGFVPLTQQIVNYMSIATISVPAISGRFFTIAKKKADTAMAQEYFSSTLSASLLGSLLLSTILLPISAYINKILNIPNYLVSDVRISFLLFCAIFLISFITSTFNIGAFSSNKLYITSTITIVNTVVKAIATVSLLLLFTPRIWYISLGALVASFIAGIITVISFVKLEPAIHTFKLSITKLKEIFSSGIWASLSEIGVILFLQIDLIVANWNLGTKITGEYAVVLAIPAILRTFSNAIISVFVPSVISLYALGKYKEMVDYLNNAVLYTGLVLSLPIGIICGLGGVVLRLWIGEYYAGYGLLLAVLSIHLSINLSVQVIMSAQTAYNKLRVPAFVTLIMGIINFSLAYVLSKYTDLGVMGIALSGALVLTVKNTVFTPLYVARITGQERKTYFRGIIKPLISTCFVFAIAFLTQYIFYIKNFYQLFFVCFVVGSIYLIFVLVFMLNKTEKNRIYVKVGELFGKG